MPAQDVVTFIAKEWSVLASAPTAFVLMLCLGALGAWWLSQKLNENQIAGLKQEIATQLQRIASKDDEIGRYKAGLHVASPDQAKAQLERHEKIIAALQTRLRELDDVDPVAIFDEVLDRKLDDGHF